MPSCAARTLLLAVLTVAVTSACGRPRADTHAPEQPAPVATPAAAEPAVDAAPESGEAAPASGAAAPAQTISFADDADPEPTTQVQAAPKRPPIPRFRLFGTREHDGPN